VITWDAIGTENSPLRGEYSSEFRTKTPGRGGWAARSRFWVFVSFRNSKVGREEIGPTRPSSSRRWPGQDDATLRRPDAGWLPWLDPAGGTTLVHRPRPFHATPPRTSSRDKGSPLKKVISWMHLGPSHPRASR
jgi:hypothetical protein